MATAAQMARRKTVQPKGRLGSRGITPSGSPFLSAPQASPFGGLNGSQPTPQQQTFGSLNGGMSFGATQSFPTGTGAPSGAFTFDSGTPISFEFSAPSVSSGANSVSFGQNNSQPSNSAFTFGQPNPQNAPNPFGSLFGNNPSNSQSNSDPTDTMMESPQKKPAFGSSLFGGSSAPNNTPFQFGQSTQQNGQQVFPPTPSQQASFGETQQNGATGFQPNLFSFGSTQPSQPAQSEPTTQPSASVFSFGQTTQGQQNEGSLFSSAQNQPAAAAQNPFSLFGASQQPQVEANNDSANQNGPATQTPKLFFGQTQQPQATSAEEQSQPKGFSFGQSQPQLGAGQTSQEPTSTFSIFGASTTQKPSLTPKPSTFSFGQSSTTPQPELNSAPAVSFPEQSSFNLFSNPSTQPASTSSLFSPAFTSSQPANNVGAGLFGAVKPAETVSGNIGDMFGRLSKPAESKGSKPSESIPTPSAGLFGMLSKPPEVKPSSNGNLFGSMSGPSQEPSSQPQAKLAEETSQNQTASLTTEKPKASSSFPSIFDGGKSHGNIFGAPKSDESSSSLAAPSKESSKPSLGGFNFSSTPASNPAADTTEFSSSTKPLFSLGGKTKPTSSAPASQPVSQPPSKSSTNALFPAQPSAAATEPPKAPTQVKARSNGPASIPRSLNIVDRAIFDKDYRLSSLDREFAKKISSVDPEKYDFAGIILFYVATREDIGQGLNLFPRSLAGTKRKDESGDQREEEQDQSRAKRARFGDADSNSTASGSTKPTPGSSGSIDGGKADSSPLFASDKSSASASLFKSMIPPSPEKEKTVPAAAPTSVALGGFTPNLGSTTPATSPPKKAGFSMPNFGSGGSVNLMDVFAKQAQESAAKLAQEAKAKRKAEEYDSEEDDEAEWERKYEEEQRAKRAKLQEVAKGGFAPTLSSTGTPAPEKPLFNFGVPKPKDQSASMTQASNSSLFGSSTASTSFPASGQQVAPSIFSTGSNSTSDSFNPAAKSLFSFGSSTSVKKPEPTKPEEELTEDDDEDAEDGSDDENHDPDYHDEDNDSEDSSKSSSDDEGRADGEADRNLEADDGDDESSSGSTNDLEAEMARSRTNANKGKSLFDRIEPNPKRKAEPSSFEGKQTGPKKAKQSPDAAESSASDAPIMETAPNRSFKGFPIGAAINQSTLTPPKLSPFTPAAAAEEPRTTSKPFGMFDFKQTQPATSSTPASGSSVLFGGPTKTGKVPFEGMFGSRPSTPTIGETSNSSNIFGSLTQGGNSTSAFSPKNDFTWKPGTPIKLGTTDAPAVNVTAATPPPRSEDSTPRPFSSLFGQPQGASSSSASGVNNANSTGFQFGAQPTYLQSMKHLDTGATASGMSSRATSPGATDNESIATNDTDDGGQSPPREEQASLMTSRPGEELEDVLFEGRSKALKYYTEAMAEKTKFKPKEYNTMGLGVVRVLKNKETGKTRILFRAEPGSNIIINTNLVPQITYESEREGKSGAVKFAMMANNNMEKWVLKVKTKEMAEELAEKLESNKSN